MEMEASSTTTTMLHRRVALRRTWPNRAFAVIYACAMFGLLYHHILNVVNHPVTIFSLLMLLADVVIVFMWATFQGFHMSPICREVYPENLSQVLKDPSEYPAMDVFICTADPYKEPPMDVVNTALSVMAYDYPTEKLSVYLSDDGGSQLTLFAFMEAAKFASHWLPYCRKNKLVDRCPEAYFNCREPISSLEGDQIKLMFESMKTRVEKVVERGSVSGDFLADEHEIKSTFTKWTTGEFTRQNHPAVIQVLSDSSIHKDVAGHAMPKLIYVSREKSKASPHHFKAGSLNVLLRVSATMTNAPIILTLDCDMYSNDPETALRAICFYLDPSMDTELAFVQFPQTFHGINKNDIYGTEFRNFIINAAGLDGLLGPHYMGTGCFFRRRALFGGPLSFVFPEIPALSPHHRVNKPIESTDVLELAHQVAGCNYETNTKWGSEVGFLYGTLVEDFYTGYRLQCEGWKSFFYNPKRPAFLGNAPITLHDLLNQTKRWSMGFLGVAFCKYSPLTYGIRSMNAFQALCYAHYALWSVWCIPILIYAFLPQIALINSLSIFPKISDPWFLLYAFLFMGAYAQDCFDFTSTGSTVHKWWNNQRIWLLRGLTCFPFALLEYFLGYFGLSTSGFNVTSKVVDSEQNKRYNQGIFEFGVPSPMFLPLTMAAIVNLVAFLRCIVLIFLRNGSFDDLFVQMFIAGFAVVNGWPIYEAIILRTDKGAMPVKITLASVALSSILYLAFSLPF